MVLAFGLMVIVGPRLLARQGGQASPGESNVAGLRVDASQLHGLHWRSIGPAVFGGRVTSVAGVPGRPNILYVGHSSGGLFRSDDGGITFESIFDHESTLSIGAVAVAPNNPAVVYVGTGEGNPRNSASFGDGIYRSQDGGKTWKHLGLEHTERFARIAINPAAPKIIYAAALGHEWGANEERGLYRSNDGGDTWTRVLYVNATTGAADVCLDPADPTVVYAAMYDYLRQPWHFRSGGPGSGLYQSSDGGNTWTTLTDRALANGLEKLGLIGRIGLAISRSRPSVVYAVIEAESGNALWRSVDHATHWTRVNTTQEVNARPFYFSAIAVDPIDENRVYSLTRSLYISTDGGRRFTEIDYWRIFGDFHAIWIDPTDPSRVLAGSDGGFYISNDRGEHWNFVNCLPFAQAYRVALDMAEPYNLLGGFQDHEVWRGPNERWNTVGVVGGDWRRLRESGDGSSVIVDPRDVNIVYYAADSGDLTRVDLRTGEERYIAPYPVAATGLAVSQEKYRFSWTPPIEMSPANPDVIYFGGNVVFRTADGGSTWTVVSRDLTTNDPEKQKLSGGITLDNSRAESHCTIISISASPVDPNVLWAGTDDGNLQVTRDAGATWANVAGNIKGAPADAWFSRVISSRRDPGSAYVSIDNHRLDDFAPYAFVTSDYGRTWRSIANGLRGYVHLVLEDPREPDLLYAGTELGVFASFDAGSHWTDLRLGLPPLPVYDIKVHPRDNDLIIATHARGFYILDDVTPLQGLARAAASSSPVTLFKPLPATRYIPVNETSSLGSAQFVAPNKSYGASISYFVRATSDSTRTELTILDPRGEIVRTLDAPVKPGINRVVWSLRRQPCGPLGRSGEGVPMETSPKVLPGQYTARLSAFGFSVEQSFTVRADPRLTIAVADLAASYDTSVRLANMECSAEAALRRIDEARVAFRNLEARLPSEERRAAAAIRTELESVGDALVSDPRGNQPLNLAIKISAMRRQVSDFSGRPTAAQLEWTGRYDQQLHETLARLDVVLKGSLAKFNARLRALGLPAVAVGGDKE
jgi:photosystem II stability/assembly factor-like uncharacterized protein